MASVYTNCETALAAGDFHRVVLSKRMRDKRDKRDKLPRVTFEAFGVVNFFIPSFPAVPLSGWSPLRAGKSFVS
jgi:hypothetical protein